jgi:hypothetical protein
LHTRHGYCLTIALGIGVNTTLFSIFNAVALKPLPIAQPDQVVRMKRWFETGSQGDIQYSFSYPEFIHVRNYNETFSSVVAASSMIAPLSRRNRHLWCHFIPRQSAHQRKRHPQGARRKCRHSTPNRCFSRSAAHGHRHRHRNQWRSCVLIFLHQRTAFPGSSDFLQGVRFYDPVAFIGLSLFVIAIALIASGRRALKVDPAVVLRHD